MRKSLKTILSVLFTLALLVGTMPISAFAAATDAATPTAAATDVAATPAATDAAATPAATDAAATPAATEWQAFLMYSAAVPDDKTWETFAPLENGANTCKVIGDGVYTVTLKASDLGSTADAQTPQVFCVDIPGFAKVLEDAGKNINNYTDVDQHDAAKHNQPTDLTTKVEVYVDGSKITCKNDKINYGDIEEKGTFRFELYNIWGLHGAAITQDPPVNDMAICPTSEIKVVFQIQGTGLNTEAGAQAIADYEASKITPTAAAAASTDTAASDDKAASTDAAETSASASDGGVNTGLIIGIVAAVVVVAVVVIVLVTRKKKA